MPARLKRVVLRKHRSLRVGDGVFVDGVRWFSSVVLVGVYTWDDGTLKSMLVQWPWSDHVVPLQHDGFRLPIAVPTHLHVGGVTETPDDFVVCARDGGGFMTIP